MCTCTSYVEHMRSLSGPERAESVEGEARKVDTLNRLIGTTDDTSIEVSRSSVASRVTVGTWGDSVSIEVELHDGVRWPDCLTAREAREIAEALTIAASAVSRAAHKFEDDVLG